MNNIVNLKDNRLAGQVNRLLKAVELGVISDEFNMSDLESLMKINTLNKVSGIPLERKILIDCLQTTKNKN